MVTVLQEIPDRIKALIEIKRVLKPNGVIAVTQFLMDPDYPLKSTTINHHRDAGFAFQNVAGNVWNYRVTARKK